MPLGFAVAGPVGAAVGNVPTFIGAAILVVVATALVLLSRDVRTLERRLALAQDVRAGRLRERRQHDLVDVHVRRPREGEQDASATSSACSGPPIATFA